MGARHFEAFGALAGVEVTAISDPAREKLEPFSRRGVKTYPKTEEMIDESGADCISIATPTAFHSALAIRALGRGLDVFCEKPMARTVQQGQAMVDAAGKAKRQLGIGYTLRFNDAYRLARETVRAGKLGKIGVVRTSRCAESRPPWLSDIEANGGATFELLTHDLDWLQWTFGPIKRVFARGLSKGKQTVQGDYTLAVARFADGTIGHLEGSLAEKSAFHMSYEIAGDAGLLTYDSRRAKVLEARLVTAQGLVSLSEAPQREGPFAREIRTFVEALESGRTYEVSGEEALPALRYAAAVEKSIQSGEPVEL